MLPLHLQPAHHGEVGRAPDALHAELQRAPVLDERAHDTDLRDVEIAAQDGRATVATDGEQRLRRDELHRRAARRTIERCGRHGGPEMAPKPPDARRAPAKPWRASMAVAALRLAGLRTRGRT